MAAPGDLVHGVVSVVPGVPTWRQAPLAGVWALGRFPGIKPCFVGLMMLTVGGRLQRIAMA